MNIECSGRAGEVDEKDGRWMWILRSTDGRSSVLPPPGDRQTLVPHDELHVALGGPLIPPRGVEQSRAVANMKTGRRQDQEQQSHDS